MGKYLGTVNFLVLRYQLSKIYSLLQKHLFSALLWEAVYCLLGYVNDLGISETVSLLFGCAGAEHSEWNGGAIRRYQTDHYFLMFFNFKLPLME
jgi:hypothetical protein